jgi:Tfp pilus assembly protein PilF
MKKFVVYLLIMVSGLSAMAQEPDAAQLHETARQFMRTGDWTNAVLLLNKALAKEPGNLLVQKDLAMTYYYQRDFGKAKETMKTLVEREDADVQTYQIAGNIYKALEEGKECDKMYRKALKKYPNSGPLYAEYGELLWMQKDQSCVQQWEQGIQNDPNYAGNYYYAARFHYFSGDKVWPLLYGEMFVNMESYTNRTAEMKTLLLEGYKKLFTTDPKVKPGKQSPFSEAVFQTWNQNQSVTGAGITTETLVMLRTRFVLDWYKENGSKYPFRLFEHQRQLLQEGMFEAYNQWIFEAAGNLAGYENWTKVNTVQYNEFTRFQKAKIFKVPVGQYYRLN